MLRSTIFPLSAFLAIALAPVLPAQQSGGRNLDELQPYQKAFFALPKEKRADFIKHQREAGRLFAEKRIFETLEELNQSEKAFEQSPEIWNMRGSCYVELRAFDKAMKCFNKALEISPENRSIHFNIGEVFFVTREWQKAHDAFAALLEKLPQDAGGLSRITEFKLMLCKIKLGKMEEAKILANKYDYLDDSPYHYFAKAALAYENDDTSEAERWIARCARIFRDNAVLAPWHDTMVECGYIKSFYGGEQ